LHHATPIYPRLFQKSAGSFQKMTVRLGGAICAVMAVFACSYVSTPVVKANSITRGAAISQSWLLRMARQHAASAERAAAEDAALERARKGLPVKVVATTDSPSGASAEISARGIGAVIARALSAGAAIKGVASTYNPFRPSDTTAGGKETASGERYDPKAWTAAIQTDLRDKFGGVRFGKDYRPVYALVATDDKQVIIKINDVGPLEPGRVIDLNEQTMRYFDPTLERGLIPHVTVTPLLGDGWLTGPLPTRSASAS
jgi:rare lipoprotein A